MKEARGRTPVSSMLTGAFEHWKRGGAGGPARPYSLLKPLISRATTPHRRPPIGQGSQKNAIIPER